MNCCECTTGNNTKVKDVTNFVPEFYNLKLHFTNMKLLVSSSQEPDAKRQRVDDSSSGAANTMTDMQANNSAYNYNWYQVGFISKQFDSTEKLSFSFSSCYTTCVWMVI